MRLNDNKLLVLLRGYEQCSTCSNLDVHMSVRLITTLKCKRGVFVVMHPSNVVYGATPPFIKEGCSHYCRSMLK